MIKKFHDRITRGLRLSDGAYAYLNLEYSRMFKRKGLCSLMSKFKRDGPLYFRSQGSDFPTMISSFLDGFHRPALKLPPNPVIFDLGMNVGYTVVDFKHHYPKSRIIGVEMDKGNINIARKNIEGMEDVEIYHAAIYHKNDTICYDASDEPDAFRAQSNSPENASLVHVEAMTVDQLIARVGVDYVDYLKMDIEGAEQEVFSNSDLEWLNKIGQVNIEIHESVDKDMIVAALTKHGIEVQNHAKHWSSIIGWRA